MEYNKMDLRLKLQTITKLREKPRATLNFSKKLNDLNISDIKFNSFSLDNTSFQEDLTICFYSRTSTLEINWYDLNLNGQELFKELFGYSIDSYFVAINSMPLLYEGLNIGFYLKELNIIYLFVNLDELNLEKNTQCLTNLGKVIQDIFEKYEIKKVDVGNEQDILIRKFKYEIANNQKSLILNFKDTCDSKKDLLNRYFEKDTQLKIIDEKIKALSGLQNSLESHLKEQINLIKELKFVEGVELTRDGIKIKFPFINIKTSEGDVPMGNYTLIILPNDIKIENQDFVVYEGETYHHPHIKQNNISFGNSREKYLELLTKKDYKTLTHFVYLYLKSFNEVDTYLSMVKWRGIKDGTIGEDSSGDVCINCGEDLDNYGICANCEEDSH